VEFLEFSQGVSNVFVLTCKGGLVCWLLANPHDFSQKSFLYPNPIFVAQILVMFWRILATILKQLSKSKMVESGCWLAAFWNRFRARMSAYSIKSTPGAFQ
jgi:hypothetical protein